MTTEIEKYIFGSYSTCALKRLVFKKNKLEINISSWIDLSTEKIFKFENVENFSEELFEDEELPFDIIGIDGSQIESGLWEFCIHCGEKEYSFRGSWPKKIGEYI